MYKKIIVISLLFSVLNVHAKEFLDKVVAVVDNNVITSNELEKQVDLNKKQLQAQNIPIPQKNILKKQALTDLINIQLQFKLAKQYGLSVGEKDINQAIERIASLNHLTVEAMRSEINKQGMTWKEYQENIRKEILLSNLQQKAVAHEIMVSNEQVERFLKTEKELPGDRSHYTYHVKSIIVPLSDNPSRQEILNAEKEALRIKKTLSHDSQFSHLIMNNPKSSFVLEDNDLGERHLNELPDLYAKEVNNMHVNQIAGPIKAGNGFHLIKLLAVSGNQMPTVHLTHVRHILLKPDANMLPEDVKKQATNLYQQLKSGKNFTEMAKNYSLDVASASKGGDLGWVSPGELVPQFEKTMNALPLHQISTPVKTQFGWHLIEVLERKEQTNTLALKKQQIRQFLYQKKFQEAVQNWQHHLKADAYVKILEKDLA